MKAVSISVRAPHMMPIDEAFIGDDVAKAVGEIAGQALREAYEQRRGKVTATVTVDVVDVEVPR